MRQLTEQLATLNEQDLVIRGSEARLQLFGKMMQELDELLTVFAPEMSQGDRDWEAVLTLVSEI